MVPVRRILPFLTAAMICMTGVSAAGAGELLSIGVSAEDELVPGPLEDVSPLLLPDTDVPERTVDTPELTSGPGTQNEELPAGGILPVISGKTPSGMYEEAEVVRGSDEGDILGVIISLYKGTEAQEENLEKCLVWDAGDGTWYDSTDMDDPRLLADGNYELFGGGTWKIRNGAGYEGYDTDLAANRWEYFLAKEDLKDPGVISRLSVENAALLPPEIFAGLHDESRYHTGMRKNGNAVCYFYKNGTMALNCHVTVNGKVYSFGKNGEYLNYVPAGEEGWIRHWDGWYWLLKDGSILNTSGFQMLGGKLYYLHPVSSRRASGFVWSSGKRFYLDPAYGDVIATKWRTINGKKYYFLVNGELPGQMLTGWLKQGGSRYYFGEDGTMAAGWQTIGPCRYYFDETGLMQKGWRRLDGSTYFFHRTYGQMQTGLQTIDQKLYYFFKNGKLAVNQTSLNINGKIYSCGKDGVLTLVSG